MARVGYGFSKCTRTRTRAAHVPAAIGYGFEEGTGIVTGGTGFRGYTRLPTKQRGTNVAVKHVQLPSRLTRLSQARSIRNKLCCLISALAGLNPLNRL